jgi:sporulation protein YhbH
MGAIVSVSRHDWSLHRKGPADQQRHKEKIKEAIRANLADIVGEESIIMADGRKVIKVPIRTLQQYRFRFDPAGQKGTGQGDGNSKVGDVVAQAPPKGRGRKQAGTEPGIDYYEAEITLDELAALIFEDLGLPNLQDKKQQEMEAESIRFKDVRRTGILPNLDKKRTILENMKRNAVKLGKAQFRDIKNEDLRFRTWDQELRRESNAVVIAMMDVSGSMGEFEKYVARSFYFWMVRFLRTKYENVKIVFISHHTEAKEVSEDEFFHKGESGGTQVSSAYRLALDIIRDRYDPAVWNIYPFHFSDGGNLPWDNDLCVQLVQEMLKVCNLFGYGEIREGHYGSPSSLLTALSRIDDPKFVAVTISDKKDVYPALRRFFSPSEQEVAAWTGS